MRIAILFILNIVFNTIANVLIRQAMAKLKDISLNSISIIFQKLVLNPTLILGAICFALGLLFYSFVLQKVNLNIAYPIVVSGSVLLVTISSKLILAEPFQLRQVGGILTILLGIFLVVK